MTPKLTLKELRIKSFITSINGNHVKGGAGGAGKAEERETTSVIDTSSVSTAPFHNTVN